MSKSEYSRDSTACLIIVIIITLAAYGLYMALADLTMVNKWTVLIVAAIVSCVIALLWRDGMGYMLGIGNRIVNKIVVLIVFTGILAAGFYSVNYWLSRGETSRQEKAVVVRKYTEKHYRTKRVARNRYTRGEPYNQYYVELQYPAGDIKPRQVNFDRYRKIKAGDSVSVDIEMGALGFPVVKNPRIR